YLVDENDRGGILLCFRKQITHARSTDAHEHFDELRCADAVKWHAGFASDGPRQEGLPGSWWTDEQNPARHLAAEPPKPLGLLQELNDFLQITLGGLEASDVAEGDTHGGGFFELAALVFDDSSQGAASACHHFLSPPREPNPNADNQYPRQQTQHQL